MQQRFLQADNLIINHLDLVKADIHHIYGQKATALLDKALVGQNVYAKVPLDPPRENANHANNKNGGLPNLIHASADPEEAKKEIKHWFKDDELFEYKTSHEHLTQ